MEGLLTRGEKQKLGDAARAFGGLLKEGASDLCPGRSQRRW